MRRVIFLLAICIATVSTTKAQAQSLSELLSSFMGANSTAAAKPAPAVHPSEKELAGTWVYHQPEMEYAGEDALASIAISSAKGQLPALAEMYGITSGKLSATIKGSRIILLSEEEKEKLSYVYTPSNGKMVITGVWNDKSVTVTGVATIKDNMVTLLFDAQELVALVANTKQYKESSVLQMMGAVINNYPGIKVGFSAKRK